HRVVCVSRQEEYLDSGAKDRHLLRHLTTAHSRQDHIRHHQVDPPRVLPRLTNRLYPVTGLQDGVTAITENVAGHWPGPRPGPRPRPPRASLSRFRSAASPGQGGVLPCPVASRSEVGIP